MSMGGEKQVKAVENEILLEEVRSLLQNGLSVTITARGYSMRPFIEHNRDSICLRALNRRARVGDAVLILTKWYMRPKKKMMGRMGGKESPFDIKGLVFAGKSSYILHRVIEVKDNLLLLQGDGVVGAQEVCSQQDVIGIVEGIYRKGKYYGVDGKAWRTYSWIWKKLRGVRYFFLLLHRIFLPGELKRIVSNRCKWRSSSTR